MDPPDSTPVPTGAILPTKKRTRGRQKPLIPGTMSFSASVPTPIPSGSTLPAPPIHSYVDSRAGPSATKYIFKNTSMNNRSTTNPPLPPATPFQNPANHAPPSLEPPPSNPNPFPSPHDAFPDPAEDETFEEQEARYHAEWDTAVERLRSIDADTESSILDRSGDFESAAADTSESSTFIQLKEPETPVSHQDKIKSILKLLRKGRISPIDILLEILDPKREDHSAFRQELYKSSGKALPKLLDMVMDDEKGKLKMREWMRPHALELICDTVYEEMDNVTKELYCPSLASLTPETIESWTLENSVVPAVNKAPVFSAILAHAAQTKKAKRRNKRKNPKTVSLELCASEVCTTSNKSLRSVIYLLYRPRISALTRASSSTHFLELFCGRRAAPNRLSMPYIDVGFVAPTTQSSLPLKTLHTTA